MILKIISTPKHEYEKRSNVFTFFALIIILLYDNTQPHVRMTLQKLTDLGHETLPHPSYSPDISPITTIFFQASGHIFTPKKKHSIPKEKLNLKIPWHQNLFYHTGIINNVNHWQKGKDLQRSYFYWLKHCLNSLIQE